MLSCGDSAALTSDYLPLNVWLARIGSLRDFASIAVWKGMTRGGLPTKLKAGTKRKEIHLINKLEKWTNKPSFQHFDVFTRRLSGRQQSIHPKIRMIMIVYSLARKHFGFPIIFYATLESFWVRNLSISCLCFWQEILNGISSKQKWWLQNEHNRALLLEQITWLRLLCLVNIATATFTFVNKFATT